MMDDVSVGCISAVFGNVIGMSFGLINGFSSGKRFCIINVLRFLFIDLFYFGASIGVLMELR